MTVTSAFARRRSGRPGPGTIIAVTLLPLAVLGLLLAALWQPQERLDTVRAAIVNNDEPVEVDGQVVPLGRQLASGLVSGGQSGDGTDGAAGDGDEAPTNYDWELTDADRARAGLADGSYSAVVTIPEDFSEAATSYSGDAADAHQATIDVATPEGGRVLDDALAQIVAGTATEVLSGTLTETYLDNLLVGFTTLNEQLGEAAGGATQLADGAQDAADGADELASGANEVADGADGLASGVGELSSGANDLATGADGLAEGAGQLSSGAGQVADGVAGSAQGAHELAGNLHSWADGTNQLADGTGQLAGGLGQLAGQIGGVNSQVEQAISQHEAELAALATALEQASAACDPAATPELCDQLETAVAAVPQSPDDTPISAFAQGLSQMAASADELATGMEQSAAGAQQLAGGTEDLAGGLDQLAGGASEVAGGADELAGGADQLASGAHGLASGVDELHTGALQLADGTGELATGTDGLASGVQELAGGTDELADGIGQAAEQVPSYGESERQNLASVASDPVSGPDTETLDTGAVGPLFTVLALWLGALVLYVVFPAMPTGVLGSTRGLVRLALSALALPAAIGALTGAAGGMILAGLEGLDVGGWVGLALVGAAVSVVFVAVNQALVAVLGHIGSGLSILVAVLVLATGVVSTAPPILLTARDVLPVGPGIDALAALVFPGLGGLGGAVAILAVWALAGVAVTVLAVRRRRTVRIQQLLAA